MLRGNSRSRFCYFRPNESALRKLCTSINQPYLIWAAVHCHVPPTKDQGDWYPQSKKRRRYRKKRSRRSPWWREVVQRWSSAGQLKFYYEILVAVSTNIELCNIKNCVTRDQTWEKFNLFHKLWWLRICMKNVKGVGGRGVGYRPLRISTLVKTAH